MPEGAFMPTEFAIHALNYKTLAAVLLIGVVPLLLVGAAVYFLGQDRMSQLAALGATSLAVIIGLLGVWQLSAIRLTADATTLTVGGGAYSVSVPMAQIDHAGARRRLPGSDDTALGLRTNGIGMPGLSLGWFRTGKGKAFAAVTDPAKVVILPTTAGYTLLVSPEDPDAFLAALRRL